MKTNVAVHRLVGPLLLWTALASCTEPAPTPKIVRVNALAAFQRALKDPTSAGNRHNDALKRFHHAIRAKHLALGRKLTRSEACEIIANESSTLVSRAGLERAQRNVSRAATWATLPTICNSASWSVASGRKTQSPPVVKGSPANRTYVDDVVYLMFNTDTLWYDGDDTAFLDSLSSTVVHVSDALSVAISSSATTNLQNAISGVMANASSTDPAVLELVGQMGSLASSSATYWEQNYQEWHEDICAQDGPENGTMLDPHSASVLDDCEEVSLSNTRLISGPRSNRGIDPGITALVKADWQSMFGDFFDLIKDFSGFFYDRMRSAGREGAEEATKAIAYTEAQKIVAREVANNGGAALTKLQIKLIAKEAAEIMVTKGFFWLDVGIAAIDSAEAYLLQR